MLEKQPKVLLLPPPPALAPSPHPPTPCSSQNQETLSNIVHVAYSLSKMPSSRQGLLDAGADRILLKISQTENQKLKANCSRSLKNLSSDATETIEEGAVAALIAMSLEVPPPLPSCLTDPPSLPPSGQSWEQER
jgi:hypothetical protein